MARLTLKVPPSGATKTPSMRAKRTQLANSRHKPPAPRARRCLAHHTGDGRHGRACAVRPATAHRPRQAATGRLGSRRCFHVDAGDGSNAISASRKPRRSAPVEAHERARPVLAARSRRVDRERLGEGGRPGRGHCSACACRRDARIEIDDAAAQHQSELVTILLNKPIGYVSGQAEDGHTPAIGADQARESLGGRSRRARRSSRRTCAASRRPAGSTSTRPGSSCSRRTAASRSA